MHAFALAAMHNVQKPLLTYICSPDYFYVSMLVPPIRCSANAHGVLHKMSVSGRGEETNACGASLSPVDGGVGEVRGGALSGC